LTKWAIFFALGLHLPSFGRFHLPGTPETVRAATRECIKKGGKRLFSGAGCEIPDGTPGENLLAQRQALCAFHGIES